MEIMRHKRKKRDVHTFLKRLSVLMAGFIPFICYLFTLIAGISLFADGKRGLAYVNTEQTALAVRTFAGTDSMLIDRLPKSSQIMVTDAAVDGRGDTWYFVKYLRADVLRTGYVHSDYVVFYNDIAPAGEDPAFEQFLNEQNFPESYKAPLRVLHKQHPSWVFHAQNIDMDWETAFTAESKPGANMVIAREFAASYYSMEEGAYDWNNYKWIELDSNCYGASATSVAYYMDPRNGLSNDTKIFQFENLGYLPEEQNAENTYNILKGTFMTGEYEFKAIQNDSLYPTSGIVPGSRQPDGTVTYKFTYLDTIMRAAAYAKVSPYHLASRLRQEMGVEATDLAKGTYKNYEGFFNFFNIGAYLHPGDPTPAREWGARYAKEGGSYLRPWTNPYRAILGGADFLGSGYIAKEQNTLYLQKFDVTDGGNGFFWHQYMSNVNAPESEASSIKRAYINTGLINTLPFTFDIPLYRNMPELAAVAPNAEDKNASNNNWLSGINVSNGTFQNAFSRTTYEYTVNVPRNFTSVEISATPYDGGAKILDTGSIQLTGDVTKHVITVLAPSLESRTYTLNIVKSGGEVPTPTPSNPTPTPTPTPGPTPTPPQDPTIESGKYRLDSYITGVDTETDVSTFLNNFAYQNGWIQLSDAAGGAKGNGIVSTGDILRLYKGNDVFRTYPVVIYGDTNGDGKITLADMVTAQKQLLKLKELSGPYFTAMDVNRDAKCSLADMVAIQRHLLRISSIQQ